MGSDAPLAQLGTRLRPTAARGIIWPLRLKCRGTPQKSMTSMLIVDQPRARDHASQEGLMNRMSVREVTRNQETSLISVPDFD